MRTLLITLSVFFFTIQSGTCQIDAQHLTSEWGELHKGEKGFDFYELIGTNSFGTYVVKNKVGTNQKKRIVLLERIDEQFNSSKILRIDFSKEDKNKSFQFVKIINNTVYVFSKHLDKKTGACTFNAQKLNEEEYVLDNNLIKICDLNLKSTGKLIGGKLEIEQSQDDSKLLFKFSFRSSKKVKEERFNLYVFDNQLNKIWEGDYTLPYVDDLLKIKDFDISNDGNVCLLGKLYNENLREYKDGKVNYQYIVLSYLNSGKEFKEFFIDQKEKFLSDMMLGFNQKQDLICAGYYSNDDVFGVKGTYFMIFDGITKEVKSSSFQEFSIELLTKNLSEKQAKRIEKKNEKGKNIELFDFDLRNIVFRNDGGAYVIGEQNKVGTIDVPTTGADGKPTTKSVKIYSYYDIFIVSISPEGKIEWTDKIVKRQTTENDGGLHSSFALIPNGDNLFFIYNEAPENLNRTENDKYKILRNSFGAVLVYTMVDPNGKMIKDKIANRQDIHITVRPVLSKKMTNKDLILVGHERRAFKYGKVSFK